MQRALDLGAEERDARDLSSGDAHVEPNLGRRGLSGRGGWLQRSADWLVSSEQRAAIDIAGFVQLAAPQICGSSFKWLPSMCVLLGVQPAACWEVLF